MVGFDKVEKNIKWLSAGLWLRCGSGKWMSKSESC